MSRVIKVTKCFECPYLEKPFVRSYHRWNGERKFGTMYICKIQGSTGKQVYFEESWTDDSICDFGIDKDCPLEVEP